MIPDTWYAPLLILAGFVIIALTSYKLVSGKRETTYVVVGKLIVAIVIIFFGVLLYRIGVTPK